MTPAYITLRLYRIVYVRGVKQPLATFRHQTGYILRLPPKFGRVGAWANQFGSFPGRWGVQGAGSLFIHMILLFCFLVYSHLS